jgi:hypothetical protein
LVADALRSAASDDAKAKISRAINSLSRNDDGRRALIAAGTFEAVADALRSAASDDAKAEISNAVSSLAPDDYV